MRPPEATWITAVAPLAEIGTDWGSPRCLEHDDGPCSIVDLHEALREILGPRVLLPFKGDPALGQREVVKEFEAADPDCIQFNKARKKDLPNLGKGVAYLVGLRLPHARPLVGSFIN